MKKGFQRKKETLTEKKIVFRILKAYQKMRLFGRHIRQKAQKKIFISRVLRDRKNRNQEASFGSCAAACS